MSRNNGGPRVPLYYLGIAAGTLLFAWLVVVVGARLRAVVSRTAGIA